MYIDEGDSMSSEIIVNAGREETRVALLENGLVTEIFIDRKKDRGIAGNVYKGRVMKVLPGMQAAFVDIGLEKSAFLYVGDVFDSTSEYTPMMEDEGLELEVEPKRKRSHATRSRTCCRKARTSWSRSRRSRSAPRARGSRPTSAFPAATSS